MLDELRIDPLAELSVLLLDADAMAALHVQWMDLPGPTDVMAFPMDGADGPVDRVDPSAPPGTDEPRARRMLGDVVLCPAVAADQASSAGHSTEAELHLLCTHGILHLLGYDHGTRTRSARCSSCRPACSSDWTQATRPRTDPGPAAAATGGEGRVLTRHVRLRPMTAADVVALVVAICLVPLGGLLACVDSALARVSVARAEEFLREERRGAQALRGRSSTDRARYTNLLLLLRVTCELTATVLADARGPLELRHALGRAVR